jgi:alpha-ketoglutarate-dependent taurine dioxygenase
MAIAFHPIEVCAAHQPFAECRGISLADELNNDAISAVREGLLKHGLLVFRNQGAMTPAQEIAFNKAFGWHDPDQNDFLFGFGAPTTEHRVSGGAQIPDLPEVSVLGNVLLDNYHGITNTQLKPVLGFTHSAWHADGLHDMFDGLPEMTTMFNPVGWQTRGGGATYFTSGVLAVERMDRDVLEELRQCVVAYVRSPNDEAPDDTRRVIPGSSRMTDEGTRRIGFSTSNDDPAAPLHDFEFKVEHADGGGRHAPIRRHPATGQEALYVTPSQAVCLLDAETGALRHEVKETIDLLARALRPSVGPEIRYEHNWREGDFVAWLNTLVLHSASDPSEIDGPRLMHRVRLSSPRRRERENDGRG